MFTETSLSHTKTGWFGTQHMPAWATAHARACSLFPEPLLSHAKIGWLGPQHMPAGATAHACWVLHPDGMFRHTQCKLPALAVAWGLDSEQCKEGRTR